MNDELNTAAYEAAYAKSKIAFEVFAPIRKAYLLGLVSDDDFLAAHAVHAAALAEFDVAYAEATR